MKYFFILLLSTTMAHAQFATADIQGFVTDSVGQPLSGVWVCIHYSGKVRTTQTNMAGYYSLPGIPVYRADLYFYRSGYIPQPFKDIYLKDGQLKQVNMILHAEGHYTSFTIYGGKVALLEWYSCVLIGEKNPGKRKKGQLFKR